MKKVLVSALLVLATAAASGSSSGAAKPILVTVSVPQHAAIADFVNGKFKETVRCREACTVKTNVLIKAAVAKRLGFTGVKGKLVLIATNKGALKGKTSTKMAFVLTRQARTRLGGAGATVQIYGSVQAFPKSRPTTNVSVGWSSSLTPT